MALPQTVTQSRDAAIEAAKTAGAYGAAEPTISDVLTQKITQAYADNQDIVQPLDVKTQEYLQAPQVAREKYQNIFNPFSRERLVAQYLGNAALPMLSLSNIYGNRLGRIEDLIGAGTRGFQSQVSAKQSAAQIAQQLYGNLLNEYVTNQQLESQRLSDEMAREKWEWEKTNSGSGGGGGGSVNAANYGAGGTQTSQSLIPTEPEPKLSEPMLQRMMSTPNVVYRSPGGQWIFNREYQAWIPAGADNVVF